MVEILGLKTLLVPGAREVGLAGSAGVDVDGVVAGLHVKADLFLLVLAGRGSDFGSIQGGDVAGDDLGGLNVEVDIIDAQLLVEPLNLVVNLALGDETSSLDDLLD